MTNRVYSEELERTPDGKMVAFVEGGKKAGQTNKEKYGSDFYKRIGSMGGKISKGGGFAANPELAREAGRKGGSKSRKRGIYGTTKTN